MRRGRLLQLARGAYYPQPGGSSPNRLTRQTFRKVRLWMIGEGDSFRTRNFRRDRTPYSPYSFHRSVTRRRTASSMTIS